MAVDTAVSFAVVSHCNYEDSYDDSYMADLLANGDSSEGTFPIQVPSALRTYDNDGYAIPDFDEHRERNAIVSVSPDSGVGQAYLHALAAGALPIMENRKLVDAVQEWAKSTETYCTAGRVAIHSGVIQVTGDIAEYHIGPDASYGYLPGYESAYTYEEMQRTADHLANNLRNELGITPPAPGKRPIRQQGLSM